MNYSRSAYFLLVFSVIFLLSVPACQQKDHQNNDQHSEGEFLNMTLRSRVETMAENKQWEVVEKEERWDPGKTAIIVTDMWDRHWCESASERVAELAPEMNNVIAEARRKGVMVIHAPSGTMDAYANTPQRMRSLNASYHEAPSGFEMQKWCYLDPDMEDALPIDDTDGGCDKPCADGSPCVEGQAWSGQIETIEISEEDFITDNGQEVYNVFMDHGIENVIVMGVHLNMCVLGRPFGIRQMVNLGKNVVLMRDMTDTMYNPEMPPHVDHFQGTGLVTEHVEKFWAPTVSSSDITGKPAFRFKEDTTAQPDVASIR